MILTFYRSISPNTTSSVPMMATISASMWFFPIWSMTARWANPGALILHLKRKTSMFKTELQPVKPYQNIIFQILQFLAIIRSMICKPFWIARRKEKRNWQQSLGEENSYFVSTLPIHFCLRACLNFIIVLKRKQFECFIKLVQEFLKWLIS